MFTYFKTSLSNLNENLYKNTFNKVVSVPQYESQPIPSENCVPIMATYQQVESMNNVLKLPRMTIKDVTSVFSYSTNPNKVIGKQLFMTEFIDELQAKNINFDVGVLCMDTISEDYLAQVCRKKQYNYRKLTVLVPSTHTYGVIIKIRKPNNKPVKAVTRMEIDVLLIYDCAVPYPESTFAQFKSVSSRRPYQRISLVTMDSAEILIFTSDEKMEWDTCVDDLSTETQHKLLYQISRHPSMHHLETWNKHMARDLAHWASQCHDPYRFMCPTSPELLNIIKTFPFHHPIQDIIEVQEIEEDKVKVQEDVQSMDEDAVEEIDKEAFEKAVEGDKKVMSDNEIESAVQSTAIPEKRYHEEDKDTTIPTNKKQKEDMDIDFDSLLQQALADFEDEISQF